MNNFWGDYSDISAKTANTGSCLYVFEVREFKCLSLTPPQTPPKLRSRKIAHQVLTEIKQ